MADNILKLVPDSMGENMRLKPDDSLDEAKSAGLETVLILGEMPDGTIYINSSVNAGVALVLMEKAKRKICFPED